MNTRSNFATLTRAAAGKRPIKKNRGPAVVNGMPPKGAPAMNPATAQGEVPPYKAPRSRKKANPFGKKTAKGC